MLDVSQDVQPFQPLRIRDYEHESAPESHPIFSHIRFRRYGDLFRPQTVLKDAHLTYPSGTDAPKAKTVTDIWGTYNVEPPDDYPGLYLADHRLVQRSFATFAPVTSMLLLNLCGHTVRERLLTGTRAITVVDVLNAIHPELVLTIHIFFMCVLIGCAGWTTFSTWTRCVNTWTSTYNASRKTGTIGRPSAPFVQSGHV